MRQPPLPFHRPGCDRGRRHRFRGAIAGAGSTSGCASSSAAGPTRRSGAFADAMVEDAAGHRVLLAPSEEVADFIAATYTFDETRIEPVSGPRLGRRLAGAVTSPSLDLTLAGGGRTGLGRALRVVPSRLAEAPTWCTLTDPVARVVLRGVRTRGTAREGRREWYGATDGARGHRPGRHLRRRRPRHASPRSTRPAASASPRRRAAVGHDRGHHGRRAQLTSMARFTQFEVTTMPTFS